MVSSRSPLLSRAVSPFEDLHTHCSPIPPPVEFPYFFVACRMLPLRSVGLRVGFRCITADMAPKVPARRAGFRRGGQLPARATRACRCQTSQTPSCAWETGHRFSYHCRRNFVQAPPEVARLPGCFGPESSRYGMSIFNPNPDNPGHTRHHFPHEQLACTCITLIKISRIVDGNILCL